MSRRGPDAGAAESGTDIHYATLDSGYRWLAFPATLETPYRRMHAARAHDVLLTMLPWVTLLYVAAALVMYGGASADGFATWAWNGLLPVMAALGWLWIARFAGLLARHAHFHTAIALAVALFASARSVFLLGEDSGAVYATYQVIYLLFIGYTVAQLRLQQALVCTTLTCLALLLDAQVEQLQADWLAFAQYFLSTTLIAGVIGYLMEHRERGEWLRGQVAALEKAEMARLKQAADSETRRQKILGDYLERIAGNLTATEIAGRSLQFLVNRSDSQVGTVYLVRGEQLRRASSYGLDGEAHTLRDELARGESLPGQVAQDGRRLRLAHLPADYHAIRSGTGSLPPSELLVEPVQQLGETVAVIELGSLRVYDDETLELVARIAVAMAGALVAANARDALTHVDVDNLMI